MANRPVFVANGDAPFYETKKVDFKYFNGFATCQKQKSIRSQHEAFLDLQPTRKVLEISSKSEVDLGVELSAFNLTFTDGFYRNMTVECAYQAGKIFEFGGPYLDLLSKTSKEAKTDPRLTQSGKIIGFRMYDQNYIRDNIEPFYSFLYINALMQNPGLAEGILKYDAFTDIIFNPRKGVACQARSAAMYAGMRQAELTDGDILDYFENAMVVQ